MAKFIPDYKDPYAIKVVGAQMDINDYFNGADFYKFFHDMLEREGFMDIDGDNTNWELRYSEKISADGSRDVKIWWRMYMPINDMFVYFLKINMTFVGVKPVEINYNGKRIKTDKVRLLLFIDAWLFVDPYKKFRKHPIIKYFWNSLYKKLYKSQIDSYYIKLKTRYEKITDRVRKYLSLHTLRTKEIPLIEHMPPRGF